MLYIARNANQLRKVLVLVGFFFAVPLFAHAATLKITPASGTYTVGQNFSVTVAASSSAQALNAVSGALGFSKDSMEIVSVSKTNSIFNLWVKEPSYANQSGTASFEGVALNPGFTGSSGKLLSYTFKVKKAGTGSVKITTASILANDGNGTELFSGAESGRYTFVVGKEKPPETPKEKAEPVVEASGVLRIKELPRTEDTGLAVRFSIMVANTKDVFTQYELRIDQGQPFIWEDSVGGGQGVFTLPTLPAGQHTLLVKTLDRGTNLTAFADFTINALEKPVVTYYTKTATIGDQVMVYGLANSQNAITVLLKQKGGVVYQQEVVPNTEGVFTALFSQEIKKGAYDLEVFAHSSTGASSEVLTGMKIHVTSGFFIHIGGLIIEGYIAGMVLGGIFLIGIILSLMNRQKKEPLSPQKSL
jgi:hypothetical protein